MSAPLPRLGRPVVWLPLRGGRTPLPVRALVVCAALLVAAALVGMAALTTGDYPISALRAAAALVGSGDAGDVLVVQQWRAPRLVLALLLGAGLGVGGAIFQSLTRNPLGSPDVMGFGTGCYTGALIAMLVLRGGFVATSVGSLVGGLATAGVVYGLSLRRGHGGAASDGFRLIITGIGVAAMLSAVNSWLVANAQVEDAMRVAVWGAGSLSGVTWGHVVPALGVLAAVGLGVALAARPLRMLELGDDLAAALGVRIETARAALMVLGIATVALVSAITGPISFVSLAAPQIARRLVRATGVPVLSAAATGALLLAASDFVAQRIHPQTPLPVGVVTVSIGGAYLVWLLVSEGRRSLR